MCRRGFAIFVGLTACCYSVAQLKAVPFASGFTEPITMVQDPTQPSIKYVVQRGGRIKVVQDGVITGDFLNITSLVSTSGERGLLGLALAPDYPTSGLAFVYYNDTSGTIQIKRYTRSTSNPLTLNAASVQNVISQVHPTFNNHNGGTIAFGPDGFLYAGLGDGGSGNDPNQNAQNPNTLLGKMIRIDPFHDDFPSDTSRNYAIPASNPFANGGGPIPAMGEIWAFGYRNPFKFSFDDPAHGGNGGLIVGDVGQDAWEEIDYEPAGRGGRNYGWRLREGMHDTGLGGNIAYQPFTDPIFEYSHSVGFAIIGGRVYRGSKLSPNYSGRYFFADEVVGKVWSLNLSYNGSGEATANDLVDHTAELGATAIGNPVSIDADNNGELYLINLGGTISRIAPVATVSGTVTLQDFQGAVPGRAVTIEIRAPGSTTPLETHTVALGAGGTFSFTTNLSPGNYDITAKASHWLRKKLSNQAIGNFGASGLAFALRNGDINGDNATSLSDFAKMRLAFGSHPTDSNWNAEADLNGDNAVTLSDFAILRLNFGLNGDA